MMRALGVLGVLLAAGLVLVGVVGRVGTSSVPGAAGPAVAAAPAAVASPAPLPRGVRASGVQPAAGWVERVSVATGVPLPAVRAYGRASLRVAEEQPGCHLGWTTLAGIGRVETDHGRFGGRTLGDDGRSSEPIAGPELDGSDFAAIREGEDWAQARGPMQFIPSTWRSWAADGDDDQVADVDDLDDAALAAARYLCAGGKDLSTVNGWNASVLSYNHSTAYVRLVFDGAESYGTRAPG